MKKSDFSIGHCLSPISYQDQLLWA